MCACGVVATCPRLNGSGRFRTRFQLDLVIQVAKEFEDKIAEPVAEYTQVRGRVHTGARVGYGVILNSTLVAHPAQLHSA